jgi:hypothetical protein
LLCGHARVGADRGDEAPEAVCAQAHVRAVRLPVGQAQIVRGAPCRCQTRIQLTCVCSLEIASPHRAPCYQTSMQLPHILYSSDEICREF